jgi:hypothetical protein
MSRCWFHALSPFDRARWGNKSLITDVAPHWVNSPMGLCAMGGLIFACGLPGWAIVRWVFNFIDRNHGAGIDDIGRKFGNLR